MLRVELDTSMDELVLQRAVVPEKSVQTPLECLSCLDVCGSDCCNYLERKCPCCHGYYQQFRKLHGRSALMLLMACNAAASGVTAKLQSQEVCCMHASASGRCLVLARQFLLHELHCVEDHDQTVCNTRSFDQF